jgi:hypothetical protein
MFMRRLYRTGPSLVGPGYERFNGGGAHGLEPGYYFALDTASQQLFDAGKQPALIGTDQ